ncbi:uncharacterized protein ELE39_000588 [Cryptosporidium sp. chipmunk genotype I]|uniref:uncharacterized protein n=1 Tax=Cryptosporidium sp. chipmunk genotype I TaxID=1280935 RepID=UPI00351AB0DD|nr:hypothetical protein ELE39_000588 [Cryptosporidium sp. chipmunk genotype I]
MIGESKIDEELLFKEQSIIESECCFTAENSKQVGVKSKIEDGFHNELVFHKLRSDSESIIQNFDQIQVFSQSNMDRVNSQNYYLTTTASSGDQATDQCNPAFPIREFEEYKKFKTELNSYPNEVQTCESDRNLIKLKITKFNSVIKEDKEKRKVIVEWLNNNEWSCKQWSCKKFGKEGAAKRAIQFLEKIHGTTINCSPEGFYSTLLKIGSIENSKSCSRRKSVDCSDRNANKNSKVSQGAEVHKFGSSLVSSSNNPSSSLKFHLSQNSHEPQTVNLIQKIMLLFSSLDSNFFNRLKEYDSRDLEWEQLHSNCRKQLRSLVLEHTRNKKFSLEEYDLIFSQTTQMLGVDQAEGDGYHFVARGIFDSIFGVKTVKEVLNKTIRSDLQLFFAVKDIIQIINMSGAEEIDIQKNELNLSQWDKIIENVSRINDDLNYLLEGGLVGYSSIACTNYGNGFFQFNCRNVSNSQSKMSFNTMINHKKSCMNLMHVDIQENGYRSVYPNYNERRRIGTRLQGKVQNLDNSELSGNSSLKLLESNSILSKIPGLNGNQIETFQGGKHCMQMSNGIYTLLDIKYGIKGGQSKEILCDMLRHNKVCYDDNKDSSNYNNIENLNFNRKYIDIGEKQNQVLEKKILRKRRYTHDSESASKIQKLDQEKVDLQASKIEWWKKPRGWKVTYYKQGQKFSQVFKVSLNSTNMEREAQYKLAYNFYLSTQEQNKKEVQTNNENDNTMNNLSCGASHINFGNIIDNNTDKLASSNFPYCIPKIFNASNLMQIFNITMNSRNISSNNVPVFGNILPLNFCLPPLFGSCNPTFYGIGVNNGSNVQNNEAFSHASMESHPGVYSSTQLPYQAFPSFIPSINPLMIPLFPSIIQNNTNLNTEWTSFVPSSKDSTPDSNIINNIMDCVEEKGT